MPCAPVGPAGPATPLGPSGPMAPMATSNSSALPLAPFGPRVSRYVPGMNPGGSSAVTTVGANPATVSTVVSRVTTGVRLPRFRPVIVSRVGLAGKSGTTASTTGFIESSWAGATAVKTYRSVAVASARVHLHCEFISFSMLPSCRFKARLLLYATPQRAMAAHDPTAEQSTRYPIMVI